MIKAIVNSILADCELESVLWNKHGALIYLHEFWCTATYLRLSKFVERLDVFGEEELDPANACQSAMRFNVEMRKIGSQGPVGVWSHSEIVKVFANVYSHDRNILSEIVRLLQHPLNKLAQKKNAVL